MRIRHPRGKISAVLVDPLAQLGPRLYSDLATGTWPAAEELAGRLREPPFELESSYLGPCVLGRGAISFCSGERYWFLLPECVELSACERRAVKGLGPSEAPVDPDCLRLAYRMPKSWEPRHTMTPFNPQGFRGRLYSQTFHGEIFHDSWALSLPLIPEGGLEAKGRAWAAFVAINVVPIGAEVVAERS